MEGYVYEVSKVAAAIKAAGRHLGFKLWPKSERVPKRSMISFTVTHRWAKLC